MEEFQGKLEKKNYESNVK